MKKSGKRSISSRFFSHVAHSLNKREIELRLVDRRIAMSDRRCRGRLRSLRAPHVSVLRRAFATSGWTRSVVCRTSSRCFDETSRLRQGSRSRRSVGDLTQPAPSQYSHGVHIVRSSDCLTRLRVMMIRPKSLNDSTLVGDLSCCKRFLQRLRDLVAVAAVFHVDQVEHDDAAEVAKADLACDLIDRFHIRPRDRVFEPGIALADKFAGVDVDRDERLGLVDDEIAARFQPNARLEGLVDLFLHAVGVEDRLVARVKLDAVDHPRLDAVDELDGAQIFLFAVDADRREIVRQLIAQQTLDEIEVLMDERRRLCLLGRLS